MSYGYLVDLYYPDGRRFEIECGPSTLQFSCVPDFQQIMQWTREFNNGYMFGVPGCSEGVYRFPLILYRKLVTGRDRYVDDLHDEVHDKDEEFYEVEFRAYVSPEVPMMDLTRFGLDLRRPIQVKASLPCLEEAGLIVQLPQYEIVNGIRVVKEPLDFDNGDILCLCRPGDRLWYQGQEYDVLTVQPESFFGNTKIPLYFNLVCDLHRMRVDQLAEQADI